MPGDGQRNRRARLAAVAVALCVVVFAGMARAAEPAAISFGTGVLLKPTDIQGWALNVDLRPDSPPRPLQLPGDELYYRLGIGQWRNLDNGTRSDANIEIIKAAIFWRYRPGLLPAPWHLDAGAGLAYFSEQQLKQGRPLGNDVLFDAELGLARPVSNGWNIGLRWRHNSNGGILGDPKRNPGSDVFLLEIGRRM